MTVLFFGRRTCYREHLISAGVKCRCDTFDIAALSCRIPAFIRDDHGYLFPVDLIVKFRKFFLKFFKFLSVFIVSQFLALKFDLGKLRHLHKFVRILDDLRSPGFLHCSVDLRNDRVGNY